MKDGAIVSNSGHFDVELDLPALRKSPRRDDADPGFVEEFTLKNGRRIYVLGEGRLINLAAAEGHPSSVMDMSFANQALSAEYMAKNHATLGKKGLSRPAQIDKEIARLKLDSMGVEIDTLTPEQEKYSHSWEMGTCKSSRSEVRGGGQVSREKALSRKLESMWCTMDFSFLCSPGVCGAPGPYAQPASRYRPVIGVFPEGFRLAQVPQHPVDFKALPIFSPATESPLRSDSDGPDRVCPDLHLFG